MNKIGKEKGITLIALIVTIIVLIILAVISMNAILGEDGIIQRAENAKQMNRAASVQEKVNLAIAENKIAQYENGTKVTRTELVEKLKTEGLLTKEEADKILGENGEEKVDKIVIDSIECDFSEIEDATTPMVTFEVYMYGVFKEFSVPVGTTWADFATSEEDYMWKTQEEYEALGSPLGEEYDVTSYGGVDIFSGDVKTYANTGAIKVFGGGPVFEYGGNSTDGPFAKPTDEIKDGVKYDCTR